MISIVVPIYNMESLLHKCIASLLQQSGEYEIILIDDGSTDHSPDVCDTYADTYPNLIRVVHKKNGGLSSARNAGIDAAKGKYIIFPDPDDWLEPDYVSKSLELQDKYSPDLLCFGYYVDYDNACEPCSANSNDRCIKLNGTEAQKALLTKSYIGGFAWNKLYHLDIIHEHKLKFLDDVGIVEDLDFAYRYLNYCSSVLAVPECKLYHYYQRNGAATHSKFSLKKLESIKAFEKIATESKEQEIVEAAKTEICNLSVNLLWEYKQENYASADVERILKKHIKNNLSYYLKSKKYGKGRKLQSVLACYTTWFYTIIKRLHTKNIYNF